MFGGDLLPAVVVGQALGLDGWLSPTLGGFAGTSNANTFYHSNGPALALTQHPHEYRWSDAMREKHPPASPAPTVQAKWFKGGAEGLVQVGGGNVTVRRLTPTECARLQSLPDDFVWPASVKKTHQYRIIGNGIASHMMWHLGCEPRNADPQSRTVIELFCGGGCGAVGLHGRFWEFKP